MAKRKSEFDQIEIDSSRPSKRLRSVDEDMPTSLFKSPSQGNLLANASTVDSQNNLLLTSIGDVESNNNTSLITMNISMTLSTTPATASTTLTNTIISNP